MSEASDRPDAPREAWELTAALRHFGWEPSGGIPGSLEVWSKETGRRLQDTVVPLDPEKGDYRALLHRARSLLQAEVGREAERFFETLSGLRAARLDRTRFAKDSSLANGLILWEQGEAAFEAARASLVAAAKASRLRRRFHGNSSAYLARRFLESAVMGQTDVGSFVVTAYLPAHERFFMTRADEDKQDGLEGVGTLTGRQIVNVLESSLEATRTALDEYSHTPNIEVFAEAVPSGVSYEMLSALSTLSSDTSESAVMISFASEERAVREVEFDFASTDVPTLSRAARFLATDRPPEDVRLRGRVTLLSRPASSEPGVIRLDVSRGTGAKRVRVRLDAEDYEAALEAHRSDVELAVSGRLEKEGQQFWLYNTTDFAVIDARSSTDEQGSGAMAQEEFDLGESDDSSDSP